MADMHRRHHLRFDPEKVQGKCLGFVRLNHSQRDQTKITSRALCPLGIRNVACSGKACGHGGHAPQARFTVRSGEGSGQEYGVVGLNHSQRDQTKRISRALCPLGIRIFACSGKACGHGGHAPQARFTVRSGEGSGQVFGVAGLNHSQRDQTKRISKT